MFRDFVYTLIQLFFRIFFRIFFRVKVIGIENIKKDSNYIFASNHLSNLDPPLVGSFSKRTNLYYFAKEELFKNRIFGELLLFVKAFPVKRGIADVDAMKKVFNILEKGNSLLIFPEGTRRKNNKFVPKKGLGFIYMNLEKKCPILPVKVINTDKFLKLKRITLIFGEPFFITGEKDYFEISKKVLDKIENLK